MQKKKKRIPMNTLFYTKAQEESIFLDKLKKIKDLEIFTNNLYGNARKSIS